MASVYHPSIFVQYNILAIFSKTVRCRPHSPRRPAPSGAMMETLTTSPPRQPRWPQPKLGVAHAQGLMSTEAGAAALPRVRSRMRSAPGEGSLRHRIGRRFGAPFRWMIAGWPRDPLRSGRQMGRFQHHPRDVADQRVPRLFQEHRRLECTSRPCDGRPAKPPSQARRRSLASIPVMHALVPGDIVEASPRRSSPADHPARRWRLPGRPVLAAPENPCR